MGSRNSMNYNRASLFVVFNKLSKQSQVEKSHDSLMSSSVSETQFRVSSDYVSDRDIDYDETDEYMQNYKYLIASSNPSIK